MLVVWEPILPTDWRAPSTTTLDRVPDPRVRQFWDPNHELSKALSGMASRKPSLPDSGTDTTNGFHWDEVIVYAPDSKWEDSPVPSFWRGPVYRSISALTTALDGLLVKGPSTGQGG